VDQVRYILQASLAKQRSLAKLRRFMATSIKVRSCVG
jgi:hypothetical protein